MKMKYKNSDLPLCPPHCCANSSFRAASVPSRPYRQIPAKTWTQIQCCPNIRPTPSRARPPPSPNWSFGVPASDGCNRTYTTRSILRCRRALSNASPPHSWWHRWTLFLGSLQIEQGKEKEEKNIIILICEKIIWFPSEDKRFYWYLKTCKTFFIIFVFVPLLLCYLSVNLCVR
jgi:hypothetical protein